MLVEFQGKQGVDRIEEFGVLYLNFGSVPDIMRASGQES